MTHFQTLGLQEAFAESRAGVKSEPTLAECRRIADANPAVLLSTPEWVAHLRCALAEVDRLRREISDNVREQERRDIQR